MWLDVAPKSHPDYPPQLLEQRVDWLTCSAPPGDDLSAMLAIADAGIARAADAGDRVREGGGHGYYTTRAGHWARALGQTGGYVQVGGVEAAAWCVPLLGLAHHCSRIDYSVTTGHHPDGPGPIPSVKRALRAYNGRHARPLTVGLHSDLDRAHGLTIGSRQSACYARIYDKHLESGGTYPPGAWRWEIELKKYASEQESEGINARPSRSEESLTILSSYLARWGISIPVAAPGATWTALQVRPQHDADRTIKWLATQVRPSVQWLGSIGRGADVERALAWLTTPNVEAS